MCSSLTPLVACEFRFGIPYAFSFEASTSLALQYVFLVRHTRGSPTPTRLSSARAFNAGCLFIFALFIYFRQKHHVPPLRPFENCSLVVNVPCPKFTPRQFSASRRASGACAARGPPGAQTPRRKRALGRRAATDATHDATDTGYAGLVRPLALGAGRAAAWHAAHAAARVPRAPRSRRGVVS